MKLIGIGQTLRPEYAPPPCLSRQEIEFVKGCLSNPNAANDLSCQNYRLRPEYAQRMNEAQFCEPNYVPYALEPGRCRDPISAGLIAYYDTYGWHGPDPKQNAWAWHAAHVPGWLNMLRLVQAVPCGVQVQTQTLSPKPSAVTCLTSAHVAQIQQCFVNPNAPGCSTVFTSKMRNTPLCPDVPRAAIPACLDATMQGVVDYCEQYGWGPGPDPQLTALCWTGMRDRDWYNRLKAQPVCGGAPDVTPEPIGPGPAVDTEDRTVTPDYTMPEDYGTPRDLGPTEEDEQAKTMWIVGGIIGTVALVGIGYLLMRKKKAG